MPSNTELRVYQIDKLYELLKIKLDNKNTQIKNLDEAINRAKTVMTKEDIAWVEKSISELYTN